MADNVSYLPNLDQVAEAMRGRQRDGGGNPPDNGDMLKRIERLEAIAEKTGERLVTIERDVAVIKATMATKEDLHRELHGTTWKLVGAIILAQLLPAIPAMLRAFKLIA